ncbi:hypothetical protein acdb102_21940 [Acidothermaceae bacterium B102]|nr:hypothetical protein acdb102_21940 [Acidothermaceae bacterium B102]
MPTRRTPHVDRENLVVLERESASNPTGINALLEAGRSEEPVTGSETGARVH